MSIFLRKQPTVIKEYDEKLVRRLIDKVIVYEDRFEVVFRSGVMVEVEVHHIIPLRDGGTNDINNLMALCKSCHSEITAREGGRWSQRS